MRVWPPTVTPTAPLLDCTAASYACLIFAARAISSSEGEKTLLIVESCAGWIYSYVRKKGMNACISIGSSHSHISQPAIAWHTHSLLAIISNLYTISTLFFQILFILIVNADHIDGSKSISLCNESHLLAREEKLSS